MADYRRADVAGATYFFTVVTAGRAAAFADEAARTLLRRVMADCGRGRAFDVVAAVVLPDHLHMIWTLPPGDCDFATRWAFIKGNFSRRYLAAGGVEQPISVSRQGRQHRGVWQKRYWEHVIRDEDDLIRHIEYIHYDPVKHGHASCPHAWEATSLHRFVRDGVYPADWCCQCERPVAPPRFDWATRLE